MVSVPWQHGRVPQPHSGKGAGLSCPLYVLLEALDRQVRVGRACGRLEDLPFGLCRSLTQVHTRSHCVGKGTSEVLEETRGIGTAPPLSTLEPAPPVAKTQGDPRTRWPVGTLPLTRIC